MPELAGNALWRKRTPGSRFGRLAAAALAIAMLAGAAPAHSATIPSSLLEQARENPGRTFDVIVQTRSGRGIADTAAMSAASRARIRSLSRAVDAVTEATRQALRLSTAAAGSPEPSTEAGPRAAAAIVLGQRAVARAEGSLLRGLSAATGDRTRTLRVISSTAERLSGRELLSLEGSSDVIAVVPDSRVQLSESNQQEWVDSVGAQWYWGSEQRRTTGGSTPTIAVVDSGIDATRVRDFGGRVIQQVDLTSGSGPNSPGDGRGHGTMVASIAAGSADAHTGVDPDARLISLDVIDDNGEGRTSDVIAAIDWILRNRAAYDIRVVNFSLQTSEDSSFVFDPLSLAVERLWLNGIVVVAAAGNYAADGAESGVRYAPASDPFVITVGAVDTGGTSDVGNDVPAPWSSWGRTRDGFLKPELSAPGRYMIGAAPSSSTLGRSGGQDDQLVGQGYLQLSGTSFAAPVVSGAAAALLALHPDWTPDHVKGALMTSSSRLPEAATGAVGVGEVDLRRALTVTSPPNPNAALDEYVVSTPQGPVFDGARWAAAANSTASWSSSAEGTASWSSSTWSQAAWSSASWSSASQEASASTSASWSSSSWTSSVDRYHSVPDGRR